VDLVGNDGVCDASDLSAISGLSGTQCGVASGGAKYTPLADFNKDGYINGTDLALLSAHVGHHCGQWSSTGPQKLTQLDEYPWDVFDMPEMQAAMAAFGVDRDFIVGVWALNGSGQRLFARGERYDREGHVAAVRGLRAPALIAHKAWTNVKVLFR
jgi:hypothetical protein